MNIIILTSYFLDLNKSIHYQFFKKNISKIIVTPSFFSDRHNRENHELEPSKFVLCSNGAALRKFLSSVKNPIIFCFLSDNPCDIKFWLSLNGYRIVVFDYAPKDMTSVIQKMVDLRLNLSLIC